MQRRTVNGWRKRDAKPIVCRQRPSGKKPVAVGARTASLRGATNLRNRSNIFREYGTLLVPSEPGARMVSDYSTWVTMFTSGAWIGLRPIITRGRRKRIRQARWVALAACRAADRGDIRSRDHVPRIAAACHRSFGMRIMDFGWCGL